MPAFMLKLKSTNQLRLAFFVIPSVKQVVQEYQPVVHRLRFSASPQDPTNPERTNLPLETFGFRRMGFSPIFSLLTPAFSLLSAPVVLSVYLRRTKYAPLPNDIAIVSAISVPCLAPLHFRRRIIRLVSYYALFKGWLLLSQPPSCLDDSTSFPTQHEFRDLNWRSGLFPFRLRALSLAV